MSTTKVVFGFFCGLFCLFVCLPQIQFGYLLWWTLEPENLPLQEGSEAWNCKPHLCSGPQIHTEPAPHIPWNRSSSKH